MRFARLLAAALLATLLLAPAGAGAAETEPPAEEPVAVCDPGAAAKKPVAVVMLAGGFTPEYVQLMNGHADRYLAQVPEARRYKRQYFVPGGLFSKIAGKAVFARYSFEGGPEVLVVPTGFDPADGVALVSLLASQYEVRSVIYAGTCGLLSDADDCRLMDPLVPTTFYRADYQYLDAKDRALFFPDWPVPALKDLFASTYKLDLSRSPLLKRIEAIDRSESWRKLPAQFLRDFYGIALKSPEQTPRIRLGTTNVTGSAFIAGLSPRAKYRDYFKAASVDMHAEQILTTAVRLGIPTAAVMTCLDKAGAELPKEDPMNALRQNWSGGVTLSLVLAVLTSRAGD